MQMVDVLEGFHADGMTVDTVINVWISRARIKHTELICLSRSYGHVLDEAELEGKESHSTQTEPWLTASIGLPHLISLASP